MHAHIMIAKLYLTLDGYMYIQGHLFLGTMVKYEFNFAYFCIIIVFFLPM